MDDPRLDKLLWSLRLYKTRPLATEACRAGQVKVGELEAKPGRNVHVGETVVVRLGQLTRTIKVTGIPPSRVGAKELPKFMEDLTPPAEYEQAKQAAKEHSLARQLGQGHGHGRPTKKLRRDISRLLGLD